MERTQIHRGEDKKIIARDQEVYMPFFASTAYAATGKFTGDIGAMVIDADPIVKLVLLILMVFSVISWAIIIQKWVTLARARKQAHLILDTLAKGGSMVKILDQVKATGDSPVARLFHVAQDELTKITGKVSPVPVNMLDNIEGRISSLSAQESMDLGKGLGFLASISNASPFIGLFGTVWGIMDSFREIGLMGSANLATVAPGISEALVATAAGLFVAIPAVLFFNYFTGVMDHISAQMDQFRIEFMNWVRRGVLYGDKK
jgi:biopolymer transport protein TolQ